MSAFRARLEASRFAIQSYEFQRGWNAALEHAMQIMAEMERMDARRMPLPSPPDAPQAGG